MKLILRYLLKYKAMLVLNIISVSGFALSELGIPTIIARMVDQGIDLHNIPFLYSQFSLICLISAAGVMGTLLLSWCSNRLSTQITYDIRKDLFAHVMSLSVQDVDHFGISSLITRSSSDPYQIMMFTNTLLRSALMAPFMLLASTILIIQTSLPLSMIVLATIPIIIIGVILVFKTAGPLSENQQKAIDKINGILRENLSGIRVIRSFNNQKLEEARFEKENRFYKTQSTRLFKLMSVSEPMFFCLMNIATLFIYYFASLMLAERTLQIGQLMAFVEYLFHCMMSVLVFCMVFMMYPKASVSAARIQAVLDTPASITSRPGADRLDNLESLEFRNVTFQYPQSEEAVLKNLSFQAYKGQKIAVIGSTGSGKSSLAKLISRFYDIQAGEILINGRPIESWDLPSLRRQIGTISQKAHIFTGTIRDNIAFGMEEAAQEKIKEAAITAQAWEFIEDRPLGLENAISEEGSNLSGGQKQRLSIARALARKPGLYIFDDSFSALDFKTDARLRQALQTWQQDAIFLIIAQRVSTIMDADTILVLDQGRIAAQGTHEQLLENCPIYREIVLSQMSLEEAMKNA